MLLDLAIAFSCAGVGLACGWVLNGLGWDEDALKLSSGDKVLTQRDVQRVTAEQDRLSLVAETLREYANRMAVDVDEHQTSVKEVNDVLTSSDDISGDAVCDAVTKLIDINDSMQKKLHKAQERIHEQAEQLESAERRAQTDALTRVSNRGAFDEHLARRHALGPERAGTLMLLDVDHFKQFNDVHGHRAGDEVLKVVANLLHSRLKSYGIVARFGGEEFAAVIDGYTVEECMKIVESARVAISQNVIEFEGKELNVTASIGLSMPLGESSIEQWIERSDSAMYYSKEHGRNCGHWMNGDKPELIVLADEPALIPAEATEEIENVESKDDKKSEQRAPSGKGRTVGAKKSKKKGASQQVSKDKDLGPFASLPTREILAGSFGELQGRSKALGMPTQMMMIHVTGEPSAGPMRTLLQIVRATLRSVDRVGAEDRSTLIVCMPGLEPSAAEARAQQIVSSADSIPFGDSDNEQKSTLKIMKVEVDEDESLDEAVRRANAS